MSKFVLKKSNYTTSGTKVGSHLTPLPPTPAAAGAAPPPASGYFSSVFSASPAVLPRHPVSTIWLPLGCSLVEKLLIWFGNSGTSLSPKTEAVLPCFFFHFQFIAYLCGYFRAIFSWSTSFRFLQNPIWVYLRQFISWQANPRDARQTDLYTMLNKQNPKGQSCGGIAGSCGIFCLQLFN
jgi:hypothetical protein